MAEMAQSGSGKDAPQIDTAQRRAEEQTAIATEEILDAINQLAYPGAAIKRVVAGVIQQARRDALVEAVKVARGYADAAKQLDVEGPYTYKTSKRRTAECIAAALDRLREGR